MSYLDKHRLREQATTGATGCLIKRTHNRLATGFVTLTDVERIQWSAVTQGKKASMRISNSHLQQLTIFTTVLTGGGIGTMYYLLQKNFAESDYHRLALQELEACPVAMESLGAPPLKVHNIHLTDRYNHVDKHTAQIKIPVTGIKTGGYLYTSSLRDPNTNRWNLKQAVLKLREGNVIDLLNPPSTTAQTQAAEHTDSVDIGRWH